MSMTGSSCFVNHILGQVVIGSKAVNYCWISRVVMHNLIVYVSSFYELAPLREDKFLNIVGDLAESVKRTAIQGVLELSSSGVF